MVVQARAAQTRQKILDTAVRVFAGNGYLETDVKAICRAADITPGAFYYHFASKEALVVDIIADGWARSWALVVDLLNATEAGLDNVLATMLAHADLLERDELVRTAGRLDQAFGYLSHQGRRDAERHVDLFVGKVEVNIRSDDLRDGVTPREVGELLWIMLQGSGYLMGDSDGTLPRVVKNWGFLLQAVAAPKVLPRLEQVLADAAAQHVRG